MLSKELKISLQEAQKLADKQHHRYVTLEHLLYALCVDKVVRQILVSCRVDIDELRRQLYLIIDSHKLVGIADEESKAQPTRSVQRVLQRAAVMAQSEEGDNEQSVSSHNVLLSLFDEEDSHAIYLLNKQGIYRADIINYLASESSRDDDYYRDDEDWPEQDTVRPRGTMRRKSALHRFTRFLNEEMRLSPTDPLIGREEELGRIIQILLRQRKNNPILIGESGTGKTALVHGLAFAIEEGDVPEAIADGEIYALDLASLVAGTRYRGDFERRMKQLINELQRKENAFLFIDEIHTIIGAGAASNNSMDVSNLLKPALADGRIRFIGATTYDEYNSSLARDKTLSRRFQRIDIREIADVESVLEGIRPRLEKFHQVHFSQTALKKAISLSGRYISDRYQPDKSIDVLDEAGAYQRSLKVNKRKKMIKEQDICQTVSRMTGLPLEALSEDKRQVLADLVTNLNLVVFGQEEAVEQLAGAVKLAWAGLNLPERPLGCYLLAGPTGVGKTEMARQLARLCAMHFVRFDMSEFSERHAVSKLIGAPPGYVGYDSGSLLTNEVTNHPHSVILFDEIEKAHPDVYDLLLQIMDYGVLTDNHHKKADFRNSFIISTTNAGAEQINRPVPGFVAQDMAGDEARVLTRIFSPEFRNRLDAMIQFNSLDEEVIVQIVDKFLTRLQTQATAKGVQLKVTNQVKKWLATGGYDKQLGARPIERLIKQKIKMPLAEQILFGGLSADTTVTITLNNNKIVLRTH